MAPFSVIIPARYGSTRLPAKALADLNGLPLIAHVVSRAKESAAREVLVATDDARIATALDGMPCQVIMTSDQHQSGSDRLAEVIDLKGFEHSHVVVNVQGDEPMIPPRLINEVATKLMEDSQSEMATAAQAIHTADDFNDPNVVKVVLDQYDRALYFSRAPIPNQRGNSAELSALHHIGIYAYRAKFLTDFAAWPASELEQLESLEQLRALENGANIAVHTIDYPAGVGVDTADDLERARELMQSGAW